MEKRKAIRLICPKCKKRLENLYCGNCKKRHYTKEGIPILVNNLSQFKREEAEFHTKIASKTKETQSLESCRIRHLHNDFLREIYNLPKNSKILEMGCGSGNDLAKIVQKGFNVVGTDISLGMCLEAKKKIKNSQFYVADAENLPFEDETFNAILIVATLHHLQNPLRALKEMKRCTKKNGLIIVGSEPNNWPYHFKRLKHSKIGITILKLFRNDYTLYKGPPGDWETEGFSKKQIKQMLTSTGLPNFEIKPFWYLNGFLQMLKINFSQKIENTIISFENKITKIPFIRALNWHWNIVVKNEG